MVADTHGEFEILAELLQKHRIVDSSLRWAFGRGHLVGPRTLLGQWLRTKPAVLKIGDLLCVHGGISREVVERKLTLQQLNAAVRDKLSGTTLSEVGQERVKFAMGQLGPLWYRGYFADQKNFPTATSGDVDRIREHFGVNTILVGHTTVPTVAVLYDGRVIAVQVHPHRDEKSGLPTMEALRIDNGRFLRARIDGMLEPVDIKSPAAVGDNVAPLSCGASP